MSDDTTIAHAASEDFVDDYDYAFDDTETPSETEGAPDLKEEGDPSPDVNPHTGSQKPADEHLDNPGTTTPESTKTRITVSPDELQALMEGRLTDEEARGLDDYLTQSNDAFRAGIHALQDEAIIIETLKHTNPAYLESGPEERNRMLAAAKEEVRKGLESIRDDAKREYHTQKVRQMEVRSRLDSFEQSLAGEELSPIRNLSDNLYRTLIEDQLLTDSEDKRHALNSILNGSLINIGDLLGIPDDKMASALARSLPQINMNTKAVSAFGDKAVKLEQARGKAKSIAGSGVDGPTQRSDILSDYDWFN